GARRRGIPGRASRTPPRTRVARRAWWSDGWPRTYATPRCADCRASEASPATHPALPEPAAMAGSWYETGSPARARAQRFDGCGHAIELGDHVAVALPG